MGYVGAFIAVAIMLGIGTLILGGTGVNCETVAGYTSGHVTAVTVSAAGNYSSAPAASLSGGGFSTAATVSTQTSAIANGFQVDGVTVVSQGQGYTSAPTVAFSGGVVNTTATATASIGSDGEQTGWAAQCIRNQTQSQAGYNLLIIVLIVLAAVVVLTVVRMLS